MAEESAQGLRSLTRRIGPSARPRSVWQQAIPAGRQGAIDGLSDGALSWLVGQGSRVARTGSLPHLLTRVNGFSGRLAGRRLVPKWWLFCAPNNVPSPTTFHIEQPPGNALSPRKAHRGQPWHHDGSVRSRNAGSHWSRPVRRLRFVADRLGELQCHVPGLPNPGVLRNGDFEVIHSGFATMGLAKMVMNLALGRARGSPGGCRRCPPDRPPPASSSPSPAVVGSFHHHQLALVVVVIAEMQRVRHCECQVRGHQGCRHQTTAADGDDPFPLADRQLTTGQTARFALAGYPTIHRTLACYRSQRVIKQSLMRRNPAKIRVQVNSGTPFPEFVCTFRPRADASAAKTDAKCEQGWGVAGGHVGWTPSRARCWAGMIAPFMDKLSGKRMRKQEMSAIFRSVALWEGFMTPTG